MDIPVGLGGVTLVLAAIVWLAAFVPGFTKRSQISETSKFVKQQQRVSDRAVPMTKDQQLKRLINTQRGFSLLFGLGFLVSATLWVLSVTNSAFVVLAVLVTLFSLGTLGVSRAAASKAAALATDLHRNRLQVRSKASKNLADSAKTREWTPNPLPAPMQKIPQQEVAEPIADVISIDKPRRTLSGSEIDQILARRRAI